MSSRGPCKHDRKRKLTRASSEPLVMGASPHCSDCAIEEGRKMAARLFPKIVMATIYWSRDDLGREVDCDGSECGHPCPICGGAYGRHDVPDCVSYAGGYFRCACPMVRPAPLRRHPDSFYWKTLNDLTIHHPPPLNIKGTIS